MGYRVILARPGEAERRSGDLSCACRSPVAYRTSCTLQIGEPRCDVLSGSLLPATGKPRGREPERSSRLRPANGRKPQTPGGARRPPCLAQSCRRGPPAGCRRAYRPECRKQPNGQLSWIIGSTQDSLVLILIVADIMGWIAGLATGVLLRRGTAPKNSFQNEGSELALANGLRRQESL